MPPLVSVNLCCYNGERYLEETLQSIFAQTYKNWELVIINDGSIDSTEEIIKRHIAEHWPIVYHYQANAGLGAARNKAIELSSGSIIAFIDQDDLWMPEKLEKEMALFSQKPDIGLVYSNCLLYLSSDHQVDFFTVVEPHKGDVLEKLAMKNFLSLPTVVTKKDVLLSSGGFCEDLVSSEDYDMWFRIAEKGPIDYVDEVLAIYRVHDESFTQINPSQTPLENLKILDRWFRRNPKLRSSLGKKVFKKVSDEYITLAKSYYKGKKITCSFSTLLKAFKIYPLNLPSFVRRFLLSLIRRLF